MSDIREDPDMFVVGQVIAIKHGLGGRMLSLMRVLEDISLRHETNEYITSFGLEEEIRLAAQKITPNASEKFDVPAELLIEDEMVMALTISFHDLHYKLGFDFEGMPAPPIFANWLVEKGLMAFCNDGIVYDMVTSTKTIKELMDGS